jgi:dihydrofolate synthase/folylpolyglutamate synthase
VKERRAANERALAEVLAELYARGTKGIRLGLDGIREVCARAGHPERSFACVHIAGTNGKGSTAAMVESIARAAKKRTGLYTSPHLSRFAERIRIDGEPIDDRRLVAVLRQALDLGPNLTFFEVATLAAFLAFRDAGVELAVLEVGLGGRLDATNVVTKPLACAVTSIDLDHTDLLGETLVEIAREKAAIAKPGVALVVSRSIVERPEVDAAIAEVAQRCGAPRIAAPESAARLRDAGLDALVPSLPGAHQRDNAEVAAVLASLAGLPSAAIGPGIARAKWPGRLERIERDGVSYLLDGAHNVEGARALRAYCKDIPVDLLVFGALADKPWPAILEELRHIPRSGILYAPPKGRPAAAGADVAQLLGRAACEIAESAQDALARVAARKPKSVLVAGSLYLVGETRALLLGLASDPPIAL